MDRRAMRYDGIGLPTIKVLGYVRRYDGTTDESMCNAVVTSRTNRYHRTGEKMVIRTCDVVRISRVRCGNIYIQAVPKSELDQYN